MEKIHRRIVFAKWFTVFWAVFFLICTLLGHRIAAAYLAVNTAARASFLQTMQLPVLLVLGYACGACVLVLLYRLVLFLTNMENGLFFTDVNIAHLRTVSVLFMAIALLVAGIAVLYSLFFLSISFAAAFLSFIVRIVADIFVQAESMKDELDLTI